MNQRRLPTLTEGAAYFEGGLINKRADSKKETGPRGVLERTLAILELLAGNAHGLHFFEIADRLKIPRSATHRLLRSLIERGYVRQEREQASYQLTAKVASLGFKFLAGSGITDLAQPILDDLARQSGELVRLSMVDGQRLVWVAKSQGSKSGLLLDLDMGEVGHLSCSSSGHAWLSCLPEKEAISLVAKQGYGSREEFGLRAPQTSDELLKYLHLARKRGFAVIERSHAPWMNAVSVPIKNALSGEVIGTIAIAGPNMRFTKKKMMEFGPILLSAADQLSFSMMTMRPTKSHRSQATSEFFRTHGELEISGSLEA